MNLNDEFETNIDGETLIKGKNKSVSTILRLLSEGKTNLEILNDTPSLTEKDIYKSLLFAAELVNSIKHNESLRLINDTINKREEMIKWLDSLKIK